MIVPIQKYSMHIKWENMNPQILEELKLGKSC